MKPTSQLDCETFHVHKTIISTSDVKGHYAIIAVCTYLNHSCQ